MSNMTPATTQYKEPMSNFWTGFSLGATVLFFLGTKKGRTVLRDLVDYAEDMEESIESIFGTTPSKGHKKDAQIVKATNISELIGKIQSTIPEISNVKRFFESQGKQLKNT